VPEKPELSTVAAILALALLAWPFGTLVPGVDGDWNWIAGLEVLAQERYRFGDEMVWTYGPLGFLHVGALVYFSGLATIAFVYQWALQLALAATLYVAARRSYPPPVAALVAFAVVTLIVDRGLLLAFAFCVLALTRPDDAPRDALARAFPIAVGVLAGILVLGKINQGVEIVAIAVATLAARPGRSASDAVAFGGALLATAAAGWLATGQALGDAWPYVRYGVEIIGGYPALAGSDPGGQWHYWAASLLFAAGSVLVWDAVRGAASARRWGLVAIWLIFSFASFKQGFIRHGAGHVLLYVTAMLTAFAVLPARRAWRWRAFATSAIAACVVLYGVIGQGSRLGDRIDPFQNAKAAVQQASTLADRERARRRSAELSEAIRGHYRLPDNLVARVGERPVAFWPFAAGDLVYAHDLNWRPLPIVEPYAIYTPALDDLAARMLESSRAPALIVRRPRPPSDVGASLERPSRELMAAPPLDPPLTTRAIFCGYREVATSEPWQLLARADRRCGEPRGLGSVEASWGETVEVPAPRRGTAVVVRIEGSGVRGLERLKALWLKPDPRMIVLDGRPYRLVPSTAPSGHLLRAAPDVDYEPPLNMAPNPSTLAVRRIGDQPSEALRFTFLELPVKRPGDGRRPGTAFRAGATPAASSGTGASTRRTAAGGL
jgi:hypothetical protein